MSENRRPLAVNVASEFHQSGVNACWISARYDVARPRPDGSASGPRTLSLALTACSPSGLRDRSLCPTSDSVRPSADISTALPGGATAWEASAEFVRLTATWSTPPAVLTCPTRAAVSRAPNGLTPLKSLCARPSQKLRALKTALMTDGELRVVVWRTGVPPREKIGSGPKVRTSWGSPGVPPPNREATTPCEPTTLFVSDVTAEARFVTSERRCSGKSLAASVPFGPSRVNAPPLGLTWFVARL